MNAAHDILQQSEVSDDGLRLTLPLVTIEKRLYAEVNVVLERLGGKWDRRSKAHLFKKDVRPALALVLSGAALPPKNPLAFFPTPEPLVRALVGPHWPIAPSLRILEPSAGTGALVAGLMNAGCLSSQIDCIEMETDRRTTLIAAGYQVVGYDFLTFNPLKPYDLVVMNPPFTSPTDKQAYIAHIRHAWGCLKPGGALSALAPVGFTYRQDRVAREFKTFVEENGHIQTTFPPEAFKGAGASVATACIYLTKPMAPSVKRPRLRSQMDSLFDVVEPA